MSGKKKRGNYIEPPMKYNPALEKFEPDMPVKMRPIKEKIDDNARAVWLIVIFLIIIAILVYLAR